MFICIHRPSDEMLFEVYNMNQTTEKYMVDLNTMVCTCKRWMLSGIPCCHAITCCKYKALDPANFIPEFYKIEAYVRCYEPIINPTNGENLWKSTPYQTFYHHQ